MNAHSKGWRLLALLALGTALSSVEATEAAATEAAATEAEAIGAASASIENGSDYVSFLAGYCAPSKSLGTTGSGATLSGIYGHEFSPRLLAELNVQSSTFETGTHGGTDFYQNGVTADAVYQWRDRRAGLFTPFLLAGVGIVYDDLYPNNRDHVGFVADAGLGVVSRPLFSAGIRLRVDARYVHDAIEGGHAEKRFVAGIDVPLGRVEHRIEYLPARTSARDDTAGDRARAW